MLVYHFYMKLRTKDLRLWRTNNRHPFLHRVQRLVANLFQTLGCALKSEAWWREESGKGSVFEREINPSL